LATAAPTLEICRNVLKPVTAVIGDIKLRMLTAFDVRLVLIHQAAGNSSRTVTIAQCADPGSASRQTHRHVVHNVAVLVDTRRGSPAGRAGR